MGTDHAQLAAQLVSAGCRVDRDRWARVQVPPALLVRPVQPKPTSPARLKTSGRAATGRPREVCLAQVRALAARGHNQAEIARMLGHSRSTICLWVQTYGIPIQQALHETARQALALAQEGLGVTAIARRLGRSRRTIRQHLDRHGIQAPRCPVTWPRKTTPEQDAAVIRLARLGMPVREIVRRTGVTRSAVYYRLKEVRDATATTAG